MNSLWLSPGKDNNYEHYRKSETDASSTLRKWVDDTYFEKGLSEYLDKDYPTRFCNTDFYPRLWELEVVEWLNRAGLKLVATNGKGPDFCVELSDGTIIWVEAVIASPDKELETIWREAIVDETSYNTPRTQVALRFSSVLVSKADKIKEKYSAIVKADDFMLIAVSAFPPGPMRPDIDLFMLGVLPIDHQLVHFSTNGQPLDPNAPLPTHTIAREHAKKSGKMVSKEFLYPGNDFPHIDGVLFSEASNLQILLGTWSSAFDRTTNTPHAFERYGNREIPEEFTRSFYYYKIRDNGPLVSMDTVDPSNQLE